MALHKLITGKGIYFITFTCHNWLSLIDLVNGYDSVYNWFNVMSAKGNTVTGYVIMPNHLHLLLYYVGGKPSLNSIVGNGKRFLAYEIVKRLQLQGEERLLTQLSYAVQPYDRKRGKKHEIWETAFDVKECRNERFVLQKLNYIHNNPCRGKWKLADTPFHYYHSSASFYFNGTMGGYPVRDYREFLMHD